MDKKLIGDFLACERKAKGLTQAQLAELLHVSDKAVSRWETGRGLPDAALMLPLCEILDISVNELLSGRRLPQPEIGNSADKNLLKLLRENSRFKLKQVAGAVISAALILVLMLALYSAEFCVNIASTQDLEAAIDAYDDPEKQTAIDVLRTEPVGRYLFVLFQEPEEECGTGLVKLERGLFGKYRFISSRVDYDPLYHACMEKISGKSCLLIYGINELPEVASFEVFDNWEMQGEAVYSSAACDAPFLNIVQPEEPPQAAHWIRYYDGGGNEIEQSELTKQFTSSHSSGGRGTGTAELFMLYVWEGILLILGVIFVRYFLTVPPEEK